MLSNIWIQLFLLSLEIYSSLQKETAAEFRAIISFSGNGTVEDPSQLPVCSKGRRISLLKYSGRVKKCEKIRCRSTIESLSREAVVKLHDCCSFQPECDNLTFLDLTRKLDNVIINYECLGYNDTIYDVCSVFVENVTGTAHLIAGSTTRQNTSCRCLLTTREGKSFGITLKDVRLYTFAEKIRQCSNSVLEIGRTFYACNETSIASGSFFNVKWREDDLHNEPVPIVLTIEDPLFKMLWITIYSQDQLTMNCTGIKPTSENATVNQLYTARATFTNNTTETDNFLKEYRNDTAIEQVNIGEVLGLSFLVMTLVAVMAVVFACLPAMVRWLKRFRRKSGCAEGDTPMTSLKAEKKYCTENTIEHVDKHQLKECKQRSKLPYCFRAQNKHKSKQSQHISLCALDDDFTDIKTTIKGGERMALQNVIQAATDRHSQEIHNQAENHLPGPSADKSVNGPMQETQQAERDGTIQNPHIYGHLLYTKNKSVPTFRDSGIYDSTNAKQQLFYKDPTYGRLVTSSTSNKLNNA